MVHVLRIDAPQPRPDCTGIRHLCLSSGERLSREQAHARVAAGEIIRSGSEADPRLIAHEKGAIRYVRTQPNDTAQDNLLQLPRGC